jgi:hypothetical protein
LSLMPAAADYAGCARGGGSGVRDWGSRALCRATAQNSAATDSRGRSTRRHSLWGPRTGLNVVLA